MESWERQTTAGNHLLFANGPLIDWKSAADKVGVHHGTAPMLVALESLQLRKANFPERAFVSIHINTRKKVDDPITVYDYGNDGLDLQWALGQLSIPNNIRDLEVAIRFDITREPLQHYYEEWFVLNAQAAKASAKPPDEPALSNVRGFQKFSNRAFAPGQENVSLNSQAAVFSRGGGTIMCSPHEDYLRFKWSLPQSRGTLLFKQLMEHESSSNGKVFAMKASDLELGQVFQLQASREQLK